MGTTSKRSSKRSSRKTRNDFVSRAGHLLKRSVKLMRKQVTAFSNSLQCSRPVKRSMGWLKRSKWGKVSVKHMKTVSKTASKGIKKSSNVIKSNVRYLHKHSKPMLRACVKPIRRSTWAKKIKGLVPVRREGVRKHRLRA